MGNLATQAHEEFGYLSYNQDFYITHEHSGVFVVGGNHNALFKKDSRWEFRFRGVPSRKLTWKPKKGPIKTTVPLKGGLYGFPC